MTAISATAVRITYQHPGYTAQTSPIYGGKKYRACLGYLLKGGTTCIDGNDQLVDYHGVTAGSTYRFQVWCNCKGSGPFAIAHPIRIFEVEYTHWAPAPANLFSPQPGDVRLRHEMTGRCLYGDAVDGHNVKTWGPCWKDPQMAVWLEPLGGSDVRIRLRVNGKCLIVGSLFSGAVTNWSCSSDPSMTFVREDLGNNRVRLRSKASGRCIYGNSANGGDVRSFPCTNDPPFIWIIDPF